MLPHHLIRKESFARNMAFAWAGFIAQAATGFVMPRVISDSLGQASLGVWDLAWGLVTYVGLAELGLSSSVNRFVARHRAQGDTPALIRSVSTVALFLKLAAGLAVVFTVVASAWFVPTAFSHLGENLRGAQIVVLVLGLEVAVSLMCAVNLGVIVGCLRSDLHYSVSTAVYGASSIGMIAAVAMGGGLPSIALVHFAATVSGDLVRWRLARAVCPELRVDYSTASWRIWREQARFTAKSTIPVVAEMVLNQSVGVLIALYLGPAALAVFSRPRNLIRQLRTLIARFGYVLIPAASSLHARAKEDELVIAVREKTYHAALIAMPIAASLVIIGDDLIRIWMGEGYVTPKLVTLFALGALPTWIHEPAWGILTGMDRHGRLAIAKLAGTLVAAATLTVGLASLGWNLTAVAAALVVPVAVADGLVVPWLVCRAFGLKPIDYVYWAWLRPALCVAPFALVLMVSRQILGQHPVSLALSFLLSASLLVIVYWAVVLPPEMRARVLRRNPV